MKKLMVLLLLVCPVLMAESYQYVYAHYHYETYGGITKLTVKLHNNADKRAFCSIDFVNQVQTVEVPAFGDGQAIFQVYTSGQPRYGCEAQ